MHTTWRDPDAERRVLAAISLDEPWGVVEAFAQLVRFSGSAEERAALDYLVERLDRWGVPYRVFWPTCLVSQPVYATLRVVAPEERVLRAKTLAFSPSTGGAELVGELVVVPGQATGELFSGELPPGLPDLRGKVVLTDGFGFAAQAVRWAATGFLLWLALEAWAGVGKATEDIGTDPEKLRGSIEIIGELSAPHVPANANTDKPVRAAQGSNGKKSSSGG